MLETDFECINQVLTLAQASELTLCDSRIGNGKENSWDRKSGLWRNPHLTRRIFVSLSFYLSPTKTLRTNVLLTKVKERELNPFLYDID